MTCRTGYWNGLTASIQSYFRDNPKSQRYVPSQRNQRIEGWSSFYGKHQSTWWINFFGDLEFQGVVNLTSELNKEFLWYCFSGVLQEDMNVVREHWNTHLIRTSRHATISGRPDMPNALSLLPAWTPRGAPDLLLKVPQQEIDYVSENIVRDNHVDKYPREYFDYARRTLNISDPTDWQEAHQFRRCRDW